MKEQDIRPADLFNKYLELCEADAITYFGSGSRRDIPCPACDSDKGTPAFEKWGFNYVSCKICGTLYQSPRPVQEDFADPLIACFHVSVIKRWLGECGYITLDVKECNVADRLQTDFRLLLHNNYKFIIFGSS